MARLEIRPIPVARTREMRQAVLRPHQAVEELATHEPPGAFAVGAFDGEHLVAVGFVGDEGSGSWRVRGMATLPEHRGLGAGTQVLDALVRHAIQSGARRIWCNARLPARSLYQRAGFDVVSERFDLPEIGPHYVMERLLEP